MSLNDDLQAANKRVGGAHLTMDARGGHLREFARYCRDNGFQIQRTDQIKEKHIKGYMESLAEKNSERTRQNKLAALRVAIRSTGKTRYADGIKTREMGVKAASRTGTKVAISKEKYCEILDKAGKLDAGAAAAIGLCRELGLRRTEAVMADSRTLKKWAERIENGQRIEVVRGTKGGRPRDTMYPNTDRARAAVAAAIAVAKQNGGHIIKTGGLKESVKRLANVASAIGLTGKNSLHSCRYAFACDRLDQLLGQGYTRHEAAILVSIDLGHGDGRGAYIEQVYSRR